MILTIATLACAAPQIVNTSGFAWNAYDDEMLAKAKVRCGELYTDARCVRWFKKWGQRDYSVICGKEK